MIEVKVVDSLTLPDMALIRIADPNGENVDTHPLQLGKDVEVKTVGDRRPRDDVDLQGADRGRRAGVQPEWLHDLRPRVRQVAQAQPVRKTRTFQQMSASDMVSKIAGENGLSPKVEATDRGLRVLPAEQRDRLGLRLAAGADARLRGRRRATPRLDFRPANKAAGAAVVLRWQDNMVSFRPRMSGVQQVQTVNVRGVGSEEQEGNVTGSAPAAPRRRRSPACSAARWPTTSAAARTVVTDRVAANNGEANAIAKSTLSRTADSFYEADGVAFGDPKIKAGAKVKIEGVGTEVRRRRSWSRRPRTATAARPATRRRFQISGPLLAHAARADPPTRRPRLVRVARGRRGDQQQRPRAIAVACA